MTWFWTRPTARKLHRCQMCGRAILPGEDYDRMAGLDGGTAWTYKCCRHCYRAADAWTRWSGDCEWDEGSIGEFLADGHPALWDSLRAGWRYPDGELMPLPFQHHCHECRARISDGRIWCQPCDLKRIDRLNAQFTEIERSFT